MAAWLMPFLKGLMGAAATGTAGAAATGATVGTAITKGVKTAGILKSVKGGVSKGGNPLALVDAYGVYKGITSGIAKDKGNQARLEKMKQAPALAPASSPSIIDDQFWLATDF